MAEIKELTVFFSAIKEDPRIGTTHISLYMALVMFFDVNGSKNPISITRSAIMKAAKISGLATYHKCVKDLSELGYIRYEPSFHPATGTLVYLLKI